MVDKLSFCRTLADCCVKPEKVWAFAYYIFFKLSDTVFAFRLFEAESSYRSIYLKTALCCVCESGMQTEYDGLFIKLRQKERIETKRDNLRFRLGYVRLACRTLAGSVSHIFYLNHNC